MRQTFTTMLLLGAAIAAGGCRPAQDPDPIPAPQAPLRSGSANVTPAAAPGAPASTATAPANAPGTDAVVVADHTPANADPRFDSRAFAGTFTAPGARLVIDADGRYAMTRRAESAGADIDSTGTWTLESGSGLLLLDPDAKGEADRRYALPSPDELAPEDGGVALRRDVDAAGH